MKQSVIEGGSSLKGRKASLLCLQLEKNSWKIRIYRHWSACRSLSAEGSDTRRHRLIPGSLQSIPLSQQGHLPHPAQTKPGLILENQTPRDAADPTSGRFLVWGFFFIFFPPLSSQSPRDIFLCASKLGFVCFFKPESSNSSICAKAGRK